VSQGVLAESNAAAPSKRMGRKGSRRIVFPFCCLI
jgi:hypothetical protein